LKEITDRQLEPPVMRMLGVQSALQRPSEVVIRKLPNERRWTNTMRRRKIKHFTSRKREKE
jgi:hypothetical protein